MVGGRGFHYGADVALPADTRRISLAIGATTMASWAGGRTLQEAASAVFEWTAVAK